jgi:MinD superfamily P-loop ATPase
MVDHVADRHARMPELRAVNAVVHVEEPTTEGVMDTNRAYNEAIHGIVKR